MDGQVNMDAAANMEIGVMFWAGRDDLAEIRRLGVSVGQLGIGDQVELTPAFAEQWQSALASEQFRVATVVAAYAGEDYADIPTVQRTVGFIPKATREARDHRTLEISDFAKVLGVGSIACHIGFVPEDRGDPDYAAVRDMVRRVCDHAERNGETFTLRTPPERAATLLPFLRRLERAHPRPNFAPAN